MHEVKITFPEAARAVLISIDTDGELVTLPIDSGFSVLNIERDLMSHLNERPFSDERLSQLMNYVAGRIEARQRAAASRGVAFPSGSEWRVVEGAVR
ncbi:hypothetical protein [Paraburkholderia acidisoli]|uniref:Uncharacterized protein n=1 Tax=Paraburkholderia acidisoli TaxID=2571748 RepID=A0A7Z2GHX6_9BURK|nr:hypothetical protein [Paraburkholderia acidisoli]QGZ62115.1 hypothetical protein FAZ98_10450 [Paraburkholderia acidisoli]